MAEPMLWVLDYVARTTQAVRRGDWLEVDDSAQDVARNALEQAEAARTAAAEQRPRADAVMEMISRRPVEAALFRQVAGLLPSRSAWRSSKPNGSVTVTATGEEFALPQPGADQQAAVAQLRGVLPKLAHPAKTTRPVDAAAETEGEITDMR